MVKPAEDKRAGCGEKMTDRNTRERNRAKPQFKRGSTPGEDAGQVSSQKEEARPSAVYH